MNSRLGMGTDGAETYAMSGSMLEPCAETCAFDHRSSRPVHVTGLCTRFYYRQRRITCFQNDLKHIEIFSDGAAQEISAGDIRPVSINLRVAVHQHAIITCYLAGPGMRVSIGSLGGVRAGHAVNKSMLAIDGCRGCGRCKLQAELGSNLNF